MSKITKIKNPISPDLINQEPVQSVWQRPVFGENSIFEDLLKKFRKQQISENSRLLHGRQMADLRVFAKTAETIDNEKFGQEEFLVFVKVKCLLRKKLNEYSGLTESIELFRAAIDAKDSFITIDQTELRYRGSKQQQFYQYIEDLLRDHEDNISFRQSVKVELADIIPQIKTEEGQIAINSYAEHLEKLSENPLGLKLLSLFKAYQLADYSILRIISEMIQSLHKKDLRDFKGLMSLVITNYQVCEKLGKIIGLSQEQSTPETYARMIQYLALAKRHAISYMKFKQLVTVLSKWFQPYQAIIEIRRAYSPKEYKQPKEFSQPIPGIQIYEKYKKWLTDKKTGMTYVDFCDS